MIHRKRAPQGCRQPSIGESFPSLRVAISGCAGNIRTCSSNVTQMMLSAIVEAKHKRKSCVWRLKSGWRNAGCDCIRTKTKIVYCKDANRRELPGATFDFLGYTFRPRLAINRRGEHFVSFIPASARKLPSKCGDACAPGDCMAQ